MSEDDPLRLTDPASGTPEELRALFQAGARDLPTDAELARLSAKLGPILGPSGSGSAAGGSMSGLGKLAAVAGALVGGAVLVASLNQEVPSSVPGARPLPTSQAAPLPEEAAVAPTTTPPASATGEPGTEPSAAERPAPRPEPLSNAEAEVRLLERARAALAQNPGHALSLTAEHRLRFPGGVLSQEREVIAIEALRRLGRSEQAALRADEFAKNYPGSAHRHKLDAGVTR